ncbi:hypothetical protein Cgig2_013348 [Carnegiea gigantea]|uniref:Uncharacterized protein n=1 Tax=Carnegiea gigantea TaxID=171969 RepID=A0A9Q1JF18_9CARY|nr:hypothetical protein Cgig2_013348 [Carnegiea gigantea]
MYQKAFIMRMTIHSFSSMVAQLNEAQTKVVRSMGFASFLKVNLKHIPWKFSKWLVESFDPYSSSFVLLDGQRFTVTAFHVYVTLCVPIKGREIMEITRSSTDEEYDEVHAAWVKEWKIEHNALELTHMLEFMLPKKDGGKSFKRNFIIYLVSCLFSRLKNRYYSKSILKYVKDKLITTVRQYKESKSAKGVHFEGPVFFLMVSSTIQQPSPFIKLINNITKHSDYLKSNARIYY